MQQKKDALNDMDFLEDLELWSINKIVGTINKMFESADRVAACLITAADQEQPDDHAITGRAKALQAIAQGLSKYTEIYGWAMANGHAAGKASPLEALLPHLEPAELTRLQGWLKRAELAERVR